MESLQSVHLQVVAKQIHTNICIFKFNFDKLLHIAAISLIVICLYADFEGNQIAKKSAVVHPLFWILCKHIN